jgi:hypothetical protein
LFHVVVGQFPDRRNFSVPQKKLQKIPYFKGLFAFRGIETSENKVTLDDVVDDPRAFNIVLEYLNIGEYPPCYPYNWNIHVKIYLLVDRLCMSTLKNQALENACFALRQALKIPDPFKVFYMPGIPVKKFIKLVQLVHENTQDVDEENGVQHPLREVLVWYAAVWFRTYKHTEDFLELMGFGGTFVEDLIARRGELSADES